MNKNNDAMPVRRSSYIEPYPDEAPPVTGKVEPLTEPSEELKKTIAETRAAQVAELQHKLEATEARLERTDAARAEAVQLAEGRQEIIEHMGAELAELHRKLEDVADNDDDDEEESAADTFFKAVERHLSIHDGGAQEILRQIEAKSPIERVAFIRGIHTLVDVMQANTHNLADLAKRSEIALEMVEG